MGRRPLPSHLKLVKGTARGDLKKKRRDDIEFPVSMPMPPEHLSDDAKVEWGRVSSMLYALRLLSDADVAALGAYCQYFAQWKQAVVSLNAAAKDDPVYRGLVIFTSNGNAIQNPLLGIANKSAADMVRVAGEFGMTPAARARIHAEGKEGTGQQDKSDRYFA